GLRKFPLFVRPMIPCVSPVPLSACILCGTIIAYPQPFEINCSFHVGSPADPNPIGFIGSRFQGDVIHPNSITTGTALLLLAGVATNISISTVMDGKAELSTTPFK